MVAAILAGCGNAADSNTVKIVEQFVKETGIMVTPENPGTILLDFLTTALLPNR